MDGLDFDLTELIHFTFKFVPTPQNSIQCRSFMSRLEFVYAVGESVAAVSSLYRFCNGTGAIYAIVMWRCLYSLVIADENAACNTKVAFFIFFFIFFMGSLRGLDTSHFSRHFCFAWLHESKQKSNINNEDYYSNLVVLRSVNSTSDWNI